MSFPIAMALSSLCRFTFEGLSGRRIHALLRWSWGAYTARFYDRFSQKSGKEPKKSLVNVFESFANFLHMFFC